MDEQLHKQLLQRLQEAIEQKKAQELISPTRQAVPGSGQGFDPNAKQKSRFGIVTTIFHQQPGDPPTTLDARHSKMLESTEQAYQRKLTLTTEWQSLDCGWLKPTEISLLAIKNDEGHFYAQPTEGEREEMSQRVVEIGIGYEDLGRDVNIVIPCWRILPGEIHLAEPVNCSDLQIRSPRKCRCTILLVPR